MSRRTETELERIEREAKEQKQAYREAKGTFCPYCGAGEMFSDMLEKHILEFHAPVHGNAQVPQSLLVNVIESARWLIDDCKRGFSTEFHSKELARHIDRLDDLRRKQ